MENFRQYVRAAICSLNQHPLDFSGNEAKIIKSIQMSKAEQAVLRVGAELQVSGYMCEDHFYEIDTVIHSWQVVANILRKGVTQGILCDVGMPALHKNVLYNCRVLLLDNKVVGIRPKMYMADGGNYFESRWFSPWKRYHVEDFQLPEEIVKLTGQKICKIGHIVIRALDCEIGFQVCEEGWVSENPMIQQALDGVDIVLNSSASHIQQGKLKRKIQMIRQLTQKHGGAYLYSNNKGCEGTRVLFDGGCMFTLNGKLQALTPIFSLSNITIARAQFSLHQIKTYRMSSRSLSRSAAENQKYLERVDIPIHLGSEEKLWDLVGAEITVEELKKIYEEPRVTYEPSAYVWDYLKKSGAAGFFLALSGGADSACVSLVVFNMCKLLFSQIVTKKKQEILQELRAVLRQPDYFPQSPQEICSLLFFTAYLGTCNSSQETKNRAKAIADEIGANHRALDFDNIFQQYVEVGSNILNQRPKFQAEGGSRNQDLSLQNIQARNRMTLTYFLAQLELESRNRPGFLLVITSSNLDESLRGYLTKYDCSSGDINPIGSMSKNTLKQYLKWNSDQGIKFVNSILAAEPTAELTPLKEGAVAQTDEQDMGMTYNELMYYGELRKSEKLGPVSMFQRIRKIRVDLSAQKIAEKIKHFFRFYAINRHKQTTITPSFHYQGSSCDDNRYDMRPFLYSDWKFQFAEIDKRVAQLNESKSQKQAKKDYLFES